MSLLLFQLRDELNRLSSLPGSTDTNIEYIRFNKHGQLEFGGETPESTALMTSLKEDAKEWQAEVNTLKEQVEDAEKLAEEAETKAVNALQELDYFTSSLRDMVQRETFNREAITKLLKELTKTN